MYADPYESKKNWGLNPEFVKKATERRKRKQRAAMIEAQKDQLTALAEKARAEREKMLRARKAANEAIRAANAAIKALQNQCSATMSGHNPKHPRTMSSILKTVSRLTGIPEKQILSPRRSQDVVMARQAVMYWCVRMTTKSYPQIGRFLQRDHTTVLHAAKAYVAKRAAMGRKLREAR